MSLLYKNISHGIFKISPPSNSKYTQPALQPPFRLLLSESSPDQLEHHKYVETMRSAAVLQLQMDVYYNKGMLSTR